MVRAANSAKKNASFGGNTELVVLEAGQKPIAKPRKHKSGKNMESAIRAIVGSSWPEAWV